MSLIAAVEQRTARARAFHALVYAVLIVLGTSMVVPFLITVTGSTANEFDYERFAPLPRYLWSRQDRFVKCLVPYFNEYRGWTGQLRAELVTMPAGWSTWPLIGRDRAGVDALAERCLDAWARQPAAIRRQAADYAEFAASYPVEDKVVYADQAHTIQFAMDHYEQLWRSKHPAPAPALSRRDRRAAALDLLAEDWGLPFDSFHGISFDTEMRYPLDFQGWFPPADSRKYRFFNDYKQAAAAHVFTPGIARKWRAWQRTRGAAAEWPAFKQQVAPADPARPFALRATWFAWLQSEEVGQRLGESMDIAVYNRLAGTAYEELYATPFPVPADFGPGIRELWRTFLAERYPLRLVTITVDAETTRRYHEFLARTLKHVRIANTLLGTDHERWEDFQVGAAPPPAVDEVSQNRQSLWKNFVKTLPPENRKYRGAEIAFQGFLRDKYGTPEAVNRAYGWRLTRFEEAFPPFLGAYVVTFVENEYSLAFLPALDNYRMVLDFLLFNGNAVVVTVILVVLTLILTLTVNPLAAYALSRFNLRGQDKILLFLLATMAFPAMVSAIPAYLLMRDLGLLNTFWALVLPGAANGMSIFILKGFFDSLPMELFEAATIDGAGEMQIFRMVALPLVKPILAINCLNAFIVAYNGWQWALIICQEKRMWTIAVWLYQASQWWTNSPWIVSAGFVVASIPTFLVFVSTQKIILRGIIIPSMK